MEKIFDLQIQRNNLWSELHNEIVLMVGKAKTLKKKDDRNVALCTFERLYQSLGQKLFDVEENLDYQIQTLYMTLNAPLFTPNPPEPQPISDEKWFQSIFQDLEKITEFEDEIPTLSAQPEEVIVQEPVTQVRSRVARFEKRSFKEKTSLPEMK